MTTPRRSCSQRARKAAEATSRSTRRTRRSEPPCSVPRRARRGSTRCPTARPRRSSCSRRCPTARAEHSRFCDHEPPRPASARARGFVVPGGLRGEPAFGFCDAGAMSADLPLCVTCGTQYASPRSDCPICEDERQYVPPSGQQWTSLRQLREDGYTVEAREQAPGVYGVGTRERFAIGQRALVVPAASGNVLWDCVAYLDDDLVRHVDELGGITAIAISHP